MAKRVQCTKCGRSKGGDEHRLCSLCRGADRHRAVARGVYRVEGDKPARRTCLRCGQPFDSWGPGNRRCEKCTTAMSGVRPVKEYRFIGGE